MNTKNVAVETIEAGMLVDLESCPFLKEHPIAEFEYATVAGVTIEFWGCVTITYEGIDTVRYKIGTLLKVVDSVD